MARSDSEQESLQAAADEEAVELLTRRVFEKPLMNLKVLSITEYGPTLGIEFKVTGSSDRTGILIPLPSQRVEVPWARSTDVTAKQWVKAFIAWMELQAESGSIERCRKVSYVELSRDGLRGT